MDVRAPDVCKCVLVLIVIDFGSLREIQLFLESVEEVKSDSTGFHDTPIA